MTPFMFGYEWFLAARQWMNDAGTRQHPEPATAEDLAPWPGLRLLKPLSEDDLIAFGRELESAEDVIGSLMAEC